MGNGFIVCISVFAKKKKNIDNIKNVRNIAAHLDINAVLLNLLMFGPNPFNSPIQATLNFGILNPTGNNSTILSIII